MLYKIKEVTISVRFIKDGRRVVRQKKDVVIQLFRLFSIGRMLFPSDFNANEGGGIQKRSKICARLSARKWSITYLLCRVALHLEIR